MLKRLMKSKKGFTLVELMVVVIILGILVAIAIPIYNNVTFDAKAKACAANIRTLEGAINMYFAQNNEYPKQIEDLNPFIKDLDSIKCPFGKEYKLANNGNGIDTTDHDHKHSSTSESTPSDDD